MPMTRRLASWIALVAMLVATPAAAYGRFECSLGMTQAGPACPLCHGEPGSPIDGPQITGQCCKYVEAKITPPEMGASFHPPTRSPLSPVACEAVPAEGARTALDPRLPLGPIPDRALQAKPSPHYLSNFLRL